MLSPEDFVKALEPHVARYKSDNSWVSWWSDEDILNSWDMYRTSSTSSLGFLLLGDTKIRMDQNLLMNFGTATAHSIQEEKERALVAELSDRRKVMSFGTKGVKYEKAKGTGSILSDDKWTPMLNDAFMLGGLHAGFSFTLAEDFFHSKTAHLQGKTAQEKWQHFFQTNKISFWDHGRQIPRVFARECMGLKAAGYRPTFSEHGLVFSGGSGIGLDFDKYLKIITTSGLTDKDLNRVMKHISEFLFNDPEALKY
jgi:hypothetical protein